MGVYIKGVKMPENCCDCPCYQDAYDFYPYCMAIEEQKIVGGGHLEINGKGRHKDCPLVEVPEPHGRLIDADALDYKLGASDRDIYVKYTLEEEPTVIEAEGE